MCDKRLPTGVVLPEMNHDWCTLNLDEIKIGIWVYYFILFIYF